MFIYVDSQSLWDPQRDGFKKACLLSAAAKGEHRSGLVEDPSGKVHVAVELVNPHERLGISASSTPDTGVAIPGPTFPPVSPSSSVGSLSSEKSTLNPNAKVRVNFFVLMCFHLCLSRPPINACGSDWYKTL